MKASRFGVIVAAAIAAAIGLSAPAYADPDTDFDNSAREVRHLRGGTTTTPTLPRYAPPAELGQGVDPDAAATAKFISNNLARGTTQVQAYQFLGTAISIYCPDLAPKLQNIPAH